ncbi:MAG TPA: energy-coupling factor ABC transporter permease [candidate division Zixibacteria bacterium]|nr:energy-coupling factor ABC transporter permease [candidate division Zixibacteria bacterium]
MSSWGELILRLPILLNTAALHIPDGFLSVPVALVGLVLAVVVLAYAIRQSQDSLGERQIPLLGVMAAFVFAAQSINFPVLGGTSGHLLGAALVSIVAGPWSAVLVMTVVVGLQALLFQDGGLLALGWNIVNMAVLAVLTATLSFRVLNRILGDSRTSLLIATVVASWLSVVVSATAAGVELAASDTGLLVTIPAIAGIHAIIGVGEALITVAAVLFIARIRPLALYDSKVAGDFRSAYVIAIGLIVAVIVATLSVLSSPSPDGLERVAIDFDFASRAIEPVMRIMPDYTLPGIDSDIGGIIVVIGGAILAFALILFFAWLIRRLRTRRLRGRHLDTQHLESSLLVSQSVGTEESGVSESVD